MSNLQTKRVIMSVINDLVSDQRVHRMASTLQAHGYEVLVIGRKLPESIPLTNRPYLTYRMDIPFRRGKLFYLTFNLVLFFQLLWRKYDILHANDLDTLLATYLAATFRRKKLIYDSHELFTEVPELVHRPLTRKIWLILERWIFPRLRVAYTVNDTIAQYYHQTYGVPVKAIRNVPFKRLENTPPADIGTESLANKRILIYQGALNVGRGIELMIDAMAYLPNAVLWIIGKGDLQEKLIAQIASQPYPERIVYKGFVPFEQLSALTLQADLGFSLEEDLGANYRFASPNKVYDYIQAHVPVLVADLPEMKKIVQEQGVGEVLCENERTPEKLAQRIHQLFAHPTTYETYQKATHKAAKLLNWENEKDRLIQLYQQYT